MTVRLSDIGSGFSGVLASLSPQTQLGSPPGLDVTVTRVDRDSLVSRIIRMTHIVALLI